MGALGVAAEAITRRLVDPVNRHQARDFPAGHADVDQAGLYAWFADEDGQRTLSDVLGGEVGELIYAGQAGATTRRSGAVRAATLRSRIGGNHLRGNITSSTFRKTLSAALLHPLGLRLSAAGTLDTTSSQLLSEWMHEHLSLTTAACPDRAALAELEEAVLLALDPPLNLMGMSPSPVRTRLRELRRALVARGVDDGSERGQHFEPVPGGSEAQLDLILAEEIATNPCLFRWLLGVPASAVVSNVKVAFNVWDLGEDGVGMMDAGENDLHVSALIDSSPQQFLIEDKVWAEFQPEQAHRYRARADFHDARAVLIAPRSRLAASTHRPFFDVVRSIEDIAAELDAQAALAAGELAVRLRWRSARLRGLATRVVPEMRPDHPPTVAFTSFCVEWLREHDDRLVANARSLRTASSGWLWFTIPKDLAYKCRHGTVDLYVGSHGFRGTTSDLESEIQQTGGPEGFLPAADTKGNPVLRWHGPSLNPSDGLPADVTPIIDALQHCLLAFRWLSERAWGS